MHSFHFKFVALDDTLPLQSIAFIIQATNCTSAQQIVEEYMNTLGFSRSNYEQVI